MVIAPFLLSHLLYVNCTCFLSQRVDTANRTNTSTPIDLSYEFGATVFGFAAGLAFPYSTWHTFAVPPIKASTYWLARLLSSALLVFCSTNMATCNP